MECCKAPCSVQYFFVMYIAPISDIGLHYAMSSHSYADDGQVNYSFKPASKVTILVGPAWVHDRGTSQDDNRYDAAQ